MSIARASFLIAAMLLSTTPAAAALPNPRAPVAALLIAKIIGETCPSALSPAETAELSRYLDLTIAIEKAKGPNEKAATEHLLVSLDLDYRSNRTCGVGDTELARDILDRVRREVELSH